MKQTVNVKELKKGGYTRFPRFFIDLLLQDYYPKNKARLKIGVFIYIFGKLANRPYNYQYADGNRVSIYEGQCVIKITAMTKTLGCTMYAARKALDELAEENAIHKKRVRNGLAVKVPFYKYLFIKEEKTQKNNNKQEQA
ncbi:hypothetical protein [Parabacteroides sp.]